MVRTLSSTTTPGAPSAGRSDVAPAGTGSTKDGFRDVLANDPLHLVRVGRQLHGTFRDRHRPTTLTPAQFAVVLALVQVPGSDQATIAELAALDQSTVGQVVRRLMNRGMVVAGSDPSDARRRVLQVTDDVLAVARADGEAVSSADRAVLRPLREAERAVLIEDLRRIAYAFRPDATRAGLVESPGIGIGIADANWAFGRLVRICQQFMASLWRDELGDRLSPVARTVLDALDTCGALRHGELGELVSLDKASTTGLLSRLQGAGLVHTSAAEPDRRGRSASLTDAGREALRASATGAGLVRARSLDPLPARERGRFLRLLRKATVDHPEITSPTSRPARPRRRGAAALGRPDTAGS